MALPLKYRKSKENIVASYNYTDVADGTGVVSLFGIRGLISAGATKFYILSQNITYNDATLQSGNLKASDSPANFDLNPFSSSRVVNGNVVFTGKIVAGTASTIIFTIYRVRNGVATSLGTDNTGNKTTTEFMTKIPISSELFKTGDTLRVAVSVTGGTGDEGLHVNSAPTTHEPFKVYVPFDIKI